MAICKHNTARNGFAAAVEYLTMQHDERGALLRDGEGAPVPRSEILIHGVNCIPETFAPLCMQDRLRFHKSKDGSRVDTHQYILSFHPDDAQKGLTMAEAQRLGVTMVQRNFPGHRALVCTHPEGGKGSKNIHVHIVISSLRYADREPDARFMRLRPDGTVKPSEYKAGCAHQDTAALRRYLLAQLNDYCAARGYAVCPEKAADKVSQKEYLAKERGVETRNDQLRRAVADAAAAARGWDDFAHRLKHDYTRMAPVCPPIPYPQRQKLWADYKTMNATFWQWDKALRASYQGAQEEGFAMLKTCRSRESKAEIRQRISTLKAKQAKQRLFRQTWQAYARAASAALRSDNQEDAQLCLEQLEELTAQREGRWQAGGGAVQSQTTWLQTTESDRELAQLTLRAVQEEAQTRKAMAQERVEVPMPIEVKLHRGEISFRHPESQRWVRGKRLGDAYTLQSLGITPPRQAHYRRRPGPEHSR